MIATTRGTLDSVSRRISRNPGGTYATPRTIGSVIDPTGFSQRLLLDESHVVEALAVAVPVARATTLLGTSSRGTRVGGAMASRGRGVILEKKPWPFP